MTMRRTCPTGGCNRWLIYGAVAVAISCMADPALAQAVPPPGMPLDAASMIRSAEPLVKVVMLILFVLSLATWTTLFIKNRTLRMRMAGLEQDVEAVSESRSFASLPPCVSPALRQMQDAVGAELSHSRQALAHGLVDGVSHRVELKLRVIEDADARMVSHGLGLLANVGSNAPFIGLLGTVWGIMHAFVGIAQAKSTSLPVVAPGIAEALFTTALGLGAAIPATIMYNMLGRRMVGYRGRLDSAVAAYLCLVSIEGERAARSRTATGRLTWVPRSAAVGNSASTRTPRSTSRHSSTFCWFC